MNFKNPYSPKEFLNFLSNFQALPLLSYITGTKSEDTIIALEDKTEIITTTPDWPMLRTTWNGKSITRPDILER